MALRARNVSGAFEKRTQVYKLATGKSRAVDININISPWTSIRIIYWKDFTVYIWRRAELSELLFAGFYGTLILLYETLVQF